LEEIKNLNVSIKTLVYRFIELPYIKRCLILRKLHLLDVEDENKEHVEILDKIIQKAKENDCVEKLWDEIKLNSHL